MKCSISKQMMMYNYTLLLLLCVVACVVKSSEIIVTSSIKVAVDLSQDGDVIILPRGVYTGQNNLNVDVSLRSITVQSEDLDPYGTIIDCNSQNTLTKARAFIYIDNTYVNPSNIISRNFTLRGITIRNCQNENQGGAIYFAVNTGNYPSSIPTPSKNTRNTTFIIDNCIFENNNVNNPQGLGGGAVFAGLVNQKTMTSKTQLMESISSQLFKDSAIPQFEPNQIEPYDLNFKSKQQKSDDSLPVLYVYFVNSIFVNNTCVGNGGAFSVTTALFFVYNCSINRNSASNGGAGLISSDAYFELTNSTFEKNYANSAGGVIVSFDYSQGQVTGCTFNNNIVLNGGGAVFYLTEAFLIAVKSNFSFNLAVGTGGVFYITGTYSGTRLDSCHFQNNTAYNHAGAIFVQGGAGLTSIASVFDGNQASSGGAISCLSSSKIAMTNSEINNNWSNQGGAIFIMYSCKSVFDQSKIQRNTAFYSGGSFYCSSSSLNITRTLVKDNVSPDQNNGWVSNLNITLGNGIYCSEVPIGTRCTVTGDPGWNTLCLSNGIQPDDTQKRETINLVLLAVGVFLGSCVFGILVGVCLVKYNEKKQQQAFPLDSAILQSENDLESNDQVSSNVESDVNNESQSEVINEIKSDVVDGSTEVDNETARWNERATDDNE